MPKVSVKAKHYYQERIRSVLVQHPQISGEGIKRKLEQQGLTLNRHYISSLVNQIHFERAKRADSWILNGALAAFQDVMFEIVAHAWEIANDPMAERSDRLAAMREIRAAHNDIFTKLFDAGVFERKLGTLDTTIRNTPLPDEKKQAIAAVFTNWGLLPAPQEEDAKPADANPAP